MTTEVLKVRYLERNGITHGLNSKGKIKTTEESQDCVPCTSSNCRFHFFHQKRVRAASCLDSKAALNKHIGCNFFFLFFQVLKKISGYIQEQNEKVYAPRGLLLTDPIERGMRVVSFPVPSTGQR